MATFTVNPINVGYDAEVSISYSDDFLAIYDLSQGDVIAQFRDQVNCPLLFEASTTDSSIERVGSNGLTIKIPAQNTAQFLLDSIRFDLVHRVSGEPDMVLPGFWIWPVRKPITRDI